MKIAAEQVAIWLDLYKFMIASRESDLVESELVNSGEANFLASSKGHEGSVILAPFLQKSDWLHCHYRDKALMLARGISSEMFFYSALAKSGSHSYGRQMVSHMSAAEHNILSIVGPVGNNALQAVGVAHAIKNQTDKPLVLCSMGDGTTQQGEVFEALAEAKRNNLPVLFFIHNNNLAISTRTAGKTFFSLPDGDNPDKFYDIDISYIDGTCPLKSYSEVKAIISKVRNRRCPQIIVFNVDRLDNHSNADNQLLYRNVQEISRSIINDPISLTQKFLLENGVIQNELDLVANSAVKSVRDAIKVARNGDNPKACFSAELPLSKELMPNAQEYRGDFNAKERLTMLEAMREVFNSQLANDDRVYLLGQDIEDNKGDVFGITRGLSTKYPGRVVNSALSESTIVGVTCGMALTGMKPVAFIQFADFMPLAYNQIFTEIATMYWRTNGLWQCPVIIFAACGGYRPGLGPFHSQTNEATYAHIPGLDVYMPSNAADAAGMLNAAFKSGRPSVFLYPKKLLNNSSIQDTTSKDILKQIIPVGKARISKIGSDITLVGWGNTVSLCHEVADTLDKIGIEVEIIDLRTIKPYDVITICKSVEKTGHLIVTHEDNHTCGVGADILASVLELVNLPIKARRVTKGDTYTPCNYQNQLEVLPSYESILTVACELLNINLSWDIEDSLDNSTYIIDVIGASPSDESVIINKLYVKIGDEVKANDIIVDIEASKSNGEILSPCSGVVEEIYVTELDKALVGSKLIKIKLPNGITNILKPQAKTPILEKNILKVNSGEVCLSQSNQGVYPVGMGVPQFKTGSLKVPNEEVLKRFPNSSSDDIFRRTGIQARYWLETNETIIDIAVNAINKALSEANLNLSDINMVICATCSPEKFLSPATSCLILDRLYQTHGEHAIQSYDINAACSGYIYALQNAKDYLQTRPNERVLLVTAEALSKRMDLSDFDTAFLFGDGATATILYGNDHIDNSKLLIEQIYLSAVAENGDILNIPVDEKAGIKLQGKPLFNFAVKTMAMVMHKCCQSANVNLPDIELVVPHQANQRIINAVESRLKLPEGKLYSNIAKYGNTSSCTIPIALAETLGKTSPGIHVALCAFGAGFTSGAAILRTIR